MLRVSIAAAMLLLAACDPGVQSTAPLFTAGAEAPQPGLWAMLPEGCPAPASAALPEWAECALPVWVRNGRLTMVMAAPAHTQLVLSRGSPRIAQLAGDDVSPSRVGRERAGRGPGFSYYAVAPEGRAPFRRGRVWELPCEEPLPEGVRRSDDDGDGGCWAQDAAAVRRMAVAAQRRAPSFTAVWVAP